MASKLSRIYALLETAFDDIREFPFAAQLNSVLYRLEGAMLSDGDKLLGDDVAVIALDSTQGPSEMAEELLEAFGTSHCAALSQLLLTFVEAERAKGRAKLTERFAELREEYGDDLQEMSEQYGAYL